MKQLTRTEMSTLEALMKRAVANSQLSINVASPYAKGEDWKKDGWDFNDRHDGNGYTSNTWNVEASFLNDEDPETGKRWNRAQLTVFVDEPALDSIMGGRS